MESPKQEALIRHCEIVNIGTAVQIGSASSLAPFKEARMGHQVHLISQFFISQTLR